ncbi:MAG: efflux RND transporter periplasmic adaptor subunit [Candidatus Omnitrophota bacterium]|nr:efflux RND transporter periplasmic adaptor subunit [Candidatus Omnitrophota bacterium]
MKKKKIIIVILLAILALFFTGLIFSRGCRVFKHSTQSGSQNLAKEIYFCPMHPDFTSDKPGSCAICGMDLVKKESQDRKPKAGKNKILYYRNPMDPEATSPVPMKDSMGMDYVPVYEEESGGEATGVYIAPEKQQLIGVTKEKVGKRRLTHQIVTVGEIAYDPDLYVAQEEYVQALKIATATKNSVLTSVAEQSNSLLKASGKKLLLLGMSKAQIEELAERGTAQENLYLPTDSDSIWVYMTIYEYEIGLISEGIPVEIDVVAFPGEMFKGKIAAITPVLNAQTRAIKVRAEIGNPEHKLKPQMFVNARINIDLGEKLAVPETAVIDTGMRKIVYVVKQDDTFEQRDVTLGQKALGYFEVLEGLKEGDIAVTSGNFLVDSESKLKGNK